MRRPAGAVHSISLSPTPLIVALLAVLAGLPTAQAQSGKDAAGQDPTTLDQVQVTGIRESMQSSINKKRDDTVIADVLSADDIGDLPAPSLADAIETLTGAASTRDKTGASEISIRGLGAFLSSTNFNGREITNGSGDRSVNFNMFPAELINTVAIYKTQRADIIEGGVAGTIGLETVRPLEYGKRAAQLDLRGSWAEYDKKYRDDDGIGYRGTASYIDQFEFGNGQKLGISLGFQRLDGTDPEESITSGSTWYACDGTQNVGNANCNEVSAQAIANGAPYYLVPSSRIYRLKQERNDRQSEFAALQWRPNDVVEVNLDFEHTERNWYENRSDLSLSNARRGVTRREVDEDGIVRHLHGSTSIDSTSNRYWRGEEYTGGGLNLILRPTPAWELSTDLSYSHTNRLDSERMTRLRANQRDVNNAIVPGISSGATGYVDYDWDWHGEVPSVALAPNFDPNNWDAYTGAARVTSSATENDHRIKAGRFDASFMPESGFFTRIRGGVRASQADYRLRDNTLVTDYDQRVAADKAKIIAANQACRAPFPQDDFMDAASGNTISSWAYFDPNCLYQSFRGSLDSGLDPGFQDPNNVDITEKTRALYLMGEFSSSLFGLPVTGNLGLRWVKTDVRSEGVRTGLRIEDNGDGTIRLQPTGAYSTQVFKAGNDKLLPSLNAAFELRPDVLLRVGAYRAMSRPDIAALGAGRTINVSSDATYGNLADALDDISASGNPAAQPLMSWNGDLSLEWYPNPDTMLAGAVYWKQFNGGTATALVPETYTIDGQSVTVPVRQQVTTDEDSTLTGFELTATHRLSYLPKPFDGLGFKVSYNYADADYRTQDSRLGEQLASDGTIIPAIVPPAGLSGFSRHVLSGSIYWDVGRFNIQAIGKFRSHYYQDFTGNTAQQNRYYDDNTSVDLRLRYRVNKRLSLSLELMNLTNEPRVAYQPLYGNFREVVTYGRRAYFGVRYKF
ncbi:TonB-dependent receptor [Stenotrophomonas maltophilia]